MVDLVVSLRERLEELNKEWVEIICWYGTPKQREEHEFSEELVRHRLEVLEEQMKANREGIPQETLMEWKHEYEKLRK